MCRSLIVHFRSQAAEAMGAIGDSGALSILESYLNDESRAVRETCEIAIDRIKFEIAKPQDVDVSNSKRYVCDLNSSRIIHVTGCFSISPFASIDPAPALIEEETSIPRLKELLMDESLPLFKRYRAMFALRNMGTEESVLVKRFWT